VPAEQNKEEKMLEEYKAKTRGSAKLFEAAKQVSPGGVMAGIKFFEPYPIFMRHAKGAHMKDVDGNDYIDYLMSYGALILGHGNEQVRRAAEQVFEKFGTTVTGTPSEIEVEYGTLLRDLYHPGGLIRFTNSGLEATLLAVRLAKAYTGRSCVAKFEGHYHGAVEHLLVSYNSPMSKMGDPERPEPVSDSKDVRDETLSESLILPFNDWESTESLIVERAEELACVILEPFEEGVIAGTPGFMRNLRKLTTDLGIPLIYDEVKTGFRVRIGGASEFYSIFPDLTCLGKIIGGGLPVGAVVGSQELMEQLGQGAKGRGGVFHSGTFNGNPMTLSVGKATIDELRSGDNFMEICVRTKALKDSISTSLSHHRIPACILGEGGMFNIYITEGQVMNYRDVQSSDLRFRRLLDMGLLNGGVYLKPTNRFCLSLAHSDDDIRVTGDKLEAVLDELGPPIPKRT